jgi:hypothetical protein
MNTTAVLRDVELEGEARHGVSQEGKAIEVYGKPTSMLTEDASFTTYIFTWKNTRPDSIDTEGKQQNTFTLAVKEASYVSVLDAIVAAL